MKFNDLKISNWKNSPYNNSSNRVFLFILTLVLIAIIPIYLLKIYQEIDKSEMRSHSQGISSSVSTKIRLGKRCNMFKGKWVPHSNMPYYTNETNCVMDAREDCMTNGRPDTEFMRWRWKPDECELPLFDGTRFLELVRGKSMAFVGDSVARNQMQSLICLLTNVTRPLDISYMMEESQHYFYPDYNFTLSHLWSHYLVGAKFSSNPLDKTPVNLTLDQPDGSWASEIEIYDFAILSSGHWYLRPLRYYEKGKFVGCHICQKEDPTDLNMYHAYRMAFRTAFKTLITLPRFKGAVIQRTITVSHANHGGGNRTEDGDCVWTRPYRREEVRRDEVIEEMYWIQVEEFRAAEREGRKKGLKFGLLNITEPMAFRPDGHPSRYGPPSHEKARRPDCLHWCLPGPVDVWNEMLLEMMKVMENERSIFGKSQ